MEKMLFNTASGNLYEVLVSGGGPDYRSLVVEIFIEKTKKWKKAGIRFDVKREVTNQEIINFAKEQAEQSVWE